MPITETREWVNDITQIETTDVVLGGATGIANQHAKELAARTNYLKDRQGTKGGTVAITTASTPVNFSLSENPFSLIVALPAVNGGEIVLNDTANSLNKTFRILASRGSNSSWTNRHVKVTFTGKTFLVGGVAKSAIYLYIDEYAEFTITEYGIIQTAGKDYDKVGLVQHGFFQPFSTVKAEGQLLDRSLYPRLWDLVKSQVVTETVWTSSRKGFFSEGNGTTTFRLPDLRNVVIRGKDSASTEGMYQADAILKHKHDNIFIGSVLLPPSNDNRSSSFVRVPYINALGSDNLHTVDMSTEETGNVAENRVKNIAYTAYIHY